MSSKGSIISIHDPPSLGTPHPAYGELNIVTLSETRKMITISGQAPISPNGTTPEGLAAQIDLSLSRLSTCLEAAGATVHDMTRFMYYFTEKAWEDPKALDLVVDKVMPFLDGHRPASCLLVVKSLSVPQFLCEFEAQAIVQS